MIWRDFGIEFRGVTAVAGTGNMDESLGEVGLEICVYLDGCGYDHWV